VEGFVLKRSVDIALAGVLLIVSLPILAVAAIAIKLDSQGPVLFCQARMGRKFRRFRILKLRTMYAGIQGRAFTVCEDPRVTRTGRWLRWLKVDELPQLWNVIRGEMSLVGPRPVVPELALEFERAYCRLLEVRPGLTDPATLKYCREEAFLVLIPDPLEYFKAVLTPDKLRISAAYLEHANVWSDLGVLAATVLCLVPGNWRPRFMRAWGVGQAEAAERLFREPAQGSETRGPIENI
jgi:lipopolysaccharide/colanic/teichoic acid biosynthesis glycosyltransferase